MWARGRCRISPPRFLAECCKRQLNQGSFLLYFRLFTFSDLYWVCLSVFSCSLLFCLSVSVKGLAVKTASEMTYIVSSGALNSTPTNPANFDSGIVRCMMCQIRANVSSTMQYQLRHLYNATGTQAMNTSSVTYRVTVAWDQLQRDVSQSILSRSLD